MMGRAGDDLYQADDAGARPSTDRFVRRAGGQRRQTLEVDREIGNGIPLGHFPALEMIEPGAHALLADLHLLDAGAAGTDEDGVEEKPAAEIGGGMEKKRVVFR